jgi:hypothetical protein
MYPQTGISGDPYRNLAAGTYYVQVQDELTQCYSDPLMLSVFDASVLPMASFAIKDQNSCDDANFTGSITANPGTGVSEDYLFEWFVGELTGVSIGDDNEVLWQVDSGVYALHMTHEISQCSNVYYPRVEEAHSIPAVTVTSVPTGGPGVGGALHALADGLSSGYTFTWFSSELSTNLLEDGGDVTGIPAGNYLVQAVNNTSKCASEFVPVLVEDGTNPEISCVPNQVRLLNADENSFTVLGVALDPVSTGDNYTVASVLNDFNGTSTLRATVLPIGTTTITWTIRDEAGNKAECSTDVEVSIATGIENIMKPEISIFPNPAADILTIEATQDVIKYLRITDLTGHMLVELTGSRQRATLDLSDFTSGVYIMSIQLGNSWYNKKIEKE